MGLLGCDLVCQALIGRVWRCIGLLGFDNLVS